MRTEMKRATFPAACGITLVIILGVVSSNEQSARSQERHDHSKHEMIIDILRDSVMLDLMMDHIASDTSRSVQMVGRLVYYAVGDTARMERLCRKWNEDPRMRSFMSQILHDLDIKKENKR